MPQKFSIQKEIFEVEATSTQHVHELQNKISHLVNFRLIQQMEDYFDEVIPQNLLLRMDQLVLDIGEVSWDSMEEEIEQRFMQQLESEFSMRLHLLKDVNNAAASGMQVETIDDGKLELFEYFLVNGVLPWYADSGKAADMDELVELLQHSHKSQLKALIKRAGQNENVRKRISYQFSEKSIQQIIETIEPTEAEYVFRTHRDIGKMQQEKQVVHTEASEFNKSVWLFILNYLLVEMSSEFSKKMFVRSNLTQIAANFNISYHDILHIFYDALEVEKRLEVFQPLQAVIYELFADDTEIVPVKKIPASVLKEKPLHVESLYDRIELIKYYLHFGTMPLSWERLDKKDLAGIMLQVARTAPLTARDILLQVKYGSVSPSELFEVLGPTGTKDILKMLFAEKERELGDIAITFSTLQDIHPFINEPAAIFTTEVWKFLLDGLLYEDLAGLDEKMIIRSVLQKISTQYAAGSSGIPAAIDEALQKIMRQKDAYAPAAAALREVVEEHGLGDKEPKTGSAEDSSRWYADEKNPVYRSARLKDVLRYILQYGSMPWWGKQYFSSSLAAMIMDLYESDKGALVLLFQKAASLPSMTERIMSNISFGVARELLQGLPKGQDALPAVDDLFVLLQASRLMQYHDEAFVQKTIASLALSELSKTGYALFSRIAFYLEAILQLSKIVNMEADAFLSVLLGSVEKISDAGSESRVAMLLRLIQDHFDQAKQKEAGKAYAEPSDETPVFSGIAPAPVLQKYFPLEDVAAPQILQDVGEALQHFLQWNRLPDTFVAIDEKERTLLLREILLTLFRYHRTALQSLLQDENNSIAAQADIAEIFSEAEGGDEKQLSIYLLQHNLPVQSAVEGEKRVEAILPPPFTDERLLDLSEVFAGDTLIPEKRSAAFIVRAAQRVLEHYLQQERLPADVHVESASKLDQLLVSVMELLFEKDRSFIAEQFQSPHASITAKMHVYDLLAVRQDIAADQLSHFLAEPQEKDFIQLLSQPGPQEINKEELSSFIMNALQQPSTTGQEEIGRLFSSAAFASTTIDRFGFPLFIKMAAKKMQWSAVEDTVISGWLNFIREAIPAGLEKEKLLDLFKQFNIHFISGRLPIGSDDAYTTALLGFLAARPGVETWVYRNLFEEAAPSKPVVHGMEDQKKLIRRITKPVILQQEQIKTVDESIRKIEQQQLAQALKETPDDHKKKQLETLKKEEDDAKLKRQQEEQEIYDNFGEDNSESIYIGNAGLILFHPFLATYFSRLELMQEKMFTDRDARNRAVLLLQYIANGRTDSAEHELVLNKILCNVPVSEAIPVSIVLTEPEIAITVELYQVLFERWPKMKNSTVDGLRGAFIMREGMLKLIEGNWHLKVEQKGYDLFLHSYPWSFSYIKNRWMDNTLIVEWM